MKSVIEVGEGRVEVHGTARLAGEIRQLITYRNVLKPLTEELESVKEIIPCAGAAYPVMTIRALTAEIAKLRQQVQKLSGDKLDEL